MFLFVSSKSTESKCLPKQLKKCYNSYTKISLYDYTYVTVSEHKKQTQI